MYAARHRKCRGTWPVPVETFLRVDPSRPIFGRDTPHQKNPINAIVVVCLGCRREGTHHNWRNVTSHYHINRTIELN